MGNKQVKQPTSKPHKILLLGCGLTGKSTIFKSILLFDRVVDEWQFTQCLESIRWKCIQSILILLKHSVYPINEANDVEKYSKILHPFVNNPEYLLNNTDQFEEIRESIEYIWNLDVIQKTFKVATCHKSFIFPVENIDFFLNKIDKIMNKNYSFSIEDYLKATIRTSGYQEHQLKNYQFKNGNDNNMLVICDVSGNNRETRWIRFCNKFKNNGNIDYVFYIVALSHYSMMECDDPLNLIYTDINQAKCALIQSIETFEEISTWSTLKNSDIIIILSKPDVFRENLKIAPLSICFGDEYKGRNFNDSINKSNNRDDFDSFIRIIRALILILLDTDDPKIIPIDILHIVAIFVRIDEWWLNLCVKDGIQFIKNKLLNINQIENKKIDIYTVNALKTEQVQQLINQCTSNWGHLIDPNK